MIIHSSCTPSVQSTEESIIKSSLSYPLSFKVLIDELIKVNDGRVAIYLERQLLDQKHPWHGGFKNDVQIPNPSTTGGVIRSLVCSYISPASEYFQSSNLAKALDLALDYMLRVQHEDGTIDLYLSLIHI